MEKLRPGMKLGASVVIFGGGIAGLWTLHKLRRAGFSAVLFESNALGGVQTFSAQGILHSGMKYTLDGMTSRQPSVLVEMLPLWRSCLEGSGEIDLRQVEVRSPCTYFWSSGFSLGGLMAPIFLKSKVAQLKERAEYPAIFNNETFTGRIHRIDEQVVDVKSLIQSLKSNAIYHGAFAGVESRIDSGQVRSVQVRLPTGDKVQVEADAFVFCGGEGNEEAARLLGFGQAIGQVRPLAMIIAENPPETLFGHCIVTSKRPRATITTHETARGKIWYCGGSIAEEGVRMSDAEAIPWARKELGEIFPWLDFSSLTLRVHRVNRAEPKQTSLMLPEGPRLRVEGNIAFAWPTKLVLAPALAADVQKWIESLKVPKASDQPFPLPAPPMGRFPWD